MNAFARPVSIAGIGSTRFGRMPERSIESLALRDRGPYLVAMVRTDSGPFVTGRLEGTDEPPAPGTRLRVQRYDGESPVFERI